MTLVADRKARKLIRGVARPNPSAVVAVTGCYAEGVGRAVLQAMPEVDLVRGTSDRALLPEAVLLELRRRRAMGLLRPVDGPATSAEPRVRAMLKVQDGCEHVCGFCIVPAVRGGHRSRPHSEVMDEARRRIDAGARELVLCGIRLGAYGWDQPDRRGSRFVPLLRLLDDLAALPGLLRLRLSSILPLDVGPDLFRHLADLPPVCEHLHLPLQSGDDELLRRIGRGYTTRRYAALVEQARAAMPGLALASDVLVGYPGETDEQFGRTLEFCRRMAFADLHIFAYSPRPGTPAAALVDDVPPAEKQARSRALHELRDELRQRFRAGREGGDAEILVERAHDHRVFGLTRDYLRIEAGGAAQPGALITVPLSADSYVSSEV